MNIVNNFTYTYEIQGITYKYLTTSENYISNATKKILKCSPLIKSLIGIGVIFSLAYETQCHLLPDTFTTMRVEDLDLDDVKIVPIPDPDDFHPLLVSICQTFINLFGNI